MTLHCGVPKQAVEKKSQRNTNYSIFYVGNDAVCIGAFTSSWRYSHELSGEIILGFFQRIIFVSIDTYNDKENHHGFGITVQVLLLMDSGLETGIRV